MVKAVSDCCFRTRHCSQLQFAPTHCTGARYSTCQPPVVHPTRIWGRGTTIWQWSSTGSLADALGRGKHYSMVCSTEQTSNTSDVGLLEGFACRAHPGIRGPIHSWLNPLTDFDWGASAYAAEPYQLSWTKGPDMRAYAVKSGL